MKNIQLKPSIAAVLESAKNANVSAMNDQFVPSYALEPNHKYVILDDMLIIEPRTTIIKGAGGKERPIAFMETYIADITNPKAPEFKKISCGQIYNSLKVVETGKREFKVINLRELAEGDLLTPSLVLLGSCLSQDDLEIVYKETVPCEMPVTNELKETHFFEGSLKTHDAIRKAFNEWKVTNGKQ